jgi:hypothetical protein
VAISKAQVSFSARNAWGDKIARCCINDIGGSCSAQAKSRQKVSGIHN